MECNGCASVADRPSWLFRPRARHLASCPAPARSRARYRLQRRSRRARHRRRLFDWSAPTSYQLWVARGSADRRHLVRDLPPASLVLLAFVPLVLIAGWDGPAARAGTALRPDLRDTAFVCRSAVLRDPRRYGVGDCSTFAGRQGSSCSVASCSGILDAVNTTFFRMDTL